MFGPAAAFRAYAAQKAEHAKILDQVTHVYVTQDYNQVTTGHGENTEVILDAKMGGFDHADFRLDGKPDIWVKNPEYPRPTTLTMIFNGMAGAGLRGSGEEYCDFTTHRRDPKVVSGKKTFKLALAEAKQVIASVKEGTLISEIYKYTYIPLDDEHEKSWVVGAYTLTCRVDTRADDCTEVTIKGPQKFPVTTDDPNVLVKVNERPRLNINTLTE